MTVDRREILQGHASQLARDATRLAERANTANPANIADEAQALAEQALRIAIRAARLDEAELETK